MAGVVDDTQVDQVFGQWETNGVSEWKIPLLRRVIEGGEFSGKTSIPWTPESVHDFMHAKIVVADDTAFLGSFNLSRSGERNAENVVEIRTPRSPTGLPGSSTRSARSIHVPHLRASRAVSDLSTEALTREPVRLANRARVPGHRGEEVFLAERVQRASVRAVHVAVRARRGAARSRRSPRRGRAQRLFPSMSTATCPLQTM